MTDAAADPGNDAALIVAAAVVAQPAVARLTGGAFGTVASSLPGPRRVVGVRLPRDPGTAAEIAVVAYAGTPLPLVAAGIADAVRAVLGDVPVDVTVADIAPAPGAADDAAATRGGPRPVA